MQFHQLSLRGISEAFRERVQVDFEALGPGLIAIVGENGAGKSTVIGCLFAALFRHLPGQKRPLYDFCTHPEPEIDVTFGVNGARYRSLLKINPQARQMESFIFDAAGVAKASGKKEAFEEFIRRHCGTRELFAASIFSNQKRTGIFLSLDRSQRKELFIRELLGLERLRLISATAKAYADQAGRRLAELEGERRGIEQLLATATTLPDIGKLDERLQELCGQIATTEQERRTAESRIEELRCIENERKALQARRSDLTRQIQRIDGQMAELGRLIEQDRSSIDSAGESNGAEQQAEAVAREIENLHDCIQGIQEVEASNAAVEETLRAIESELLMGRDRCERAEREAAEVELVPCHGRGEYAGCVKLRRAVEARDQVPELRGSIATLELERTVQRVTLAPVPERKGCSPPKSGQGIFHPSRHVHFPPRILSRSTRARAVRHRSSRRPGESSQIVPEETRPTHPGVSPGHNRGSSTSDGTAQESCRSHRP